MNIAISTKALATALSELAPISARKTPLLILNYIKFVVKGMRMRLQASDGETTVRKYLDLDFADSEGEFLVNGTDINAYVSALKSDQCILDVADNIVAIQSGKSKAKFPTMPPEGFYEPLTPEDAVEVVIPSALLKATISAASKFVSNDMIRPTTRNIRAIIAEGKFTFCATDTRKLIADSVELSGDNPDAAWYVEQNAFGSLTKLCNGGNDVCVKVAENIVSYKCGDNVVFTVQTQGKFPDFNRVIPQNSFMTCEFDKNEAISALRRIKPFTEDSRLVKLSLSGMEAMMQTCNLAEGKEASDSFLCTIDGEVTLGLHADHFDVCLGAVDSNDFVMELKQASSPLKIRDKEHPNRAIILMPMNIGG